jgi:hypothetical protein
MAITHIFSFLVHPAKNVQEQPPIGGTHLRLQGNLFRMLAKLFDRSDDECNIEISFNPNSAGQAQNDCRDEITGLLTKPEIARARVLASRLQAVTTNRSGLGLLFLIIGDLDGSRKIYISRFPADVGILAQEDQMALRVEFIEKVFMRNALAYKAAVYCGASLSSDFWTGWAVDRQINSGVVSISSYWIREFLLSDFRTTPAAGTRRLALALREAMNCAETMNVKEEIAASARLASSLDGRTISVEGFAQQFGISPKTREAVIEKLKQPSLSFDRFQFSFEEFRKHLPYRSVELNNGAILTASSTGFDDCFTRAPVAGADGEYEFRTQGTIVDDRFRKTK